MAPDKYSSFAELLAHEQSDIDYQIMLEDRGSEYLIMAPHGGTIERGTSELALRITGNDLSFYIFEGLRKRPHSDLHVTSHKYDEKQALEIAKRCETVVAVHGRADRSDPDTVWLGGLDIPTQHKIKNILSEAGFHVSVSKDEIAGKHPSNICNRGRTGKGVQLEIPKSLRDELVSNSEYLEKFADAIRLALSPRQE